MASKKKLLQAAAGAAGGGATTDITDVFSTFLYDGTGATQTIQNGINLGSSFGGQSYSFDGSDDLLLRTSDFTSNTDSKTFTFSCWYFSNLDQTGYWYTTSNGASNNGRVIIGRANGNLQVMCYNNSGSLILGVSTSANIPYGTWNHIVVSIDLANTSNRYVYINDSAYTVSYNTYTNDTIGFSNTTHAVSGNSYSSTSSGQTSLAHVFLDYTYRDLSVESNRRLFYSSSGEPATGQASLNPIMYMTLTSESSPNTNSGTGGDFTTQGSPTYNSNFGPDAGESGEGGLVWIKDRDSGSNSHMLYDTERGAYYAIKSNTTDANQFRSTGLTAFNSNGFTLGSLGAENSSGNSKASWTFRKAPKFFDVVTWTGSNFGGGRQISHNLGSVPGIIIIKRTSAVSAWYVWHRSRPNAYTLLDQTDAEDTSNTKYYFGDGTNVVAPTSTEFTTQTLNENGFTYVAYLFAHNDSGDGEFGPNADQDVVKCGSYTGTGSSQLTVDLGFEPQWLLVKRTDTAKDWILHDTMRGFGASGNFTSWLEPNTSDAEATATADWLEVTPTGFSSTSTQSRVNASGGTYIYMAIRRGPLAPPESATEVFEPVAYTGDGTTGRVIGSIDRADLVIAADRDNDSSLSGYGTIVYDRLRGEDLSLQTNSTSVEVVGWADAYFNLDQSGGWRTGDTSGGINYFNKSSSDYISWAWKRAPGYFDVVAYTGTGSNRTIAHNLGVAPEMMWLKERSGTFDWNVYHKDLGGADKYLHLNATDAVMTATNRFNNTNPTASVFSLGTSSALNDSGATHIAYLFATVAGVSKVGSYTGTGSDINIDCGFSNGARFVLIKNVNAAEQWFVFDSQRGISTSTSDPFLYLSITNAENPNNDIDIDPLSSGFKVASGGTQINGNGNTHIFYAIA